MKITLDYVILGHVVNPDQDKQSLEILAYSEGAPSLDVGAFYELVDLEPMPIHEDHDSQSLAMVAYDHNTIILARADYQQDNPNLPVYQYIFIPYDILSGIGGRISPLLSLVQMPIPIYESSHNIVPPLTLPTIATGNLNTRVTQLERVIEDLLDNRFPLALTLVGAVIHERQLLIRNFPKDVSQRIDLVQGLRMLLPFSIAMRMSFTSYTSKITDHTPMLAFADDVDETTRWLVDWHNPQTIPALLEHPYIQLLQTLWKNDISELVAKIKPMDSLSRSYIHEVLPADNLQEITQRFQLDQQVQQRDDSVETEAMIDALEHEGAPQGALRYQYIEKLLQNALNNRDTVAGKLVAQELNRDANLEEALSGMFDGMLDSQPDTVYVFIRNRLNNFGVDENWLQRLKTAATQSLEVATDDGDVNTLTSWLELIAREPHAYELDDVLKQGIIDAQPRAYDDGELGIRLILIAARRVPDILDRLYADGSLMDALPDNVGDALRNKTTESLSVLMDEEPEYFLLALSHAVQTSDKQVVDTSIIQKLWSLHESEEKFTLPQVYQPYSLIRALGSQFSYQMTDPAIDTLLGNIIEANDTDLFVDVATHLVSRDILFPRFGMILKSRNLSFDQILNLMNWVADIDNVSSKGLIDTYFELLDEFGWDETTQQMMESVARLLMQNPTITIAIRYIWKLFEACTTLKLESPSRVSMNRILGQLSENDDSESAITEIVRVYRQITWSKLLLETFNYWWRTYTHSRTLVQLQRLDREVESQRGLEVQRQILQTTIAMRRLLDNRDLSEFAQAINTAYSVLENIVDAFDKSQLAEVDAITIRNELDSVSGELAPDERHILSKNLRELAQHVITMADNRSKSSLIRSDEAIDRQLMSGKANPQGAIDVMKWMAGYLGGTHAPDEDE